MPPIEAESPVYRTNYRQVPANLTDQLGRVHIR